MLMKFKIKIKIKSKYYHKPLSKNPSKIYPYEKLKLAS